MQDGVTSSGTPPKPERAVPAALRPLLWMGFPQSLLTWKPRLPSRNWSIFWASAATVTFLYYEDRRQCRKILQEYKDRVRGLAEEPLAPGDFPRKVTVYTAKYPGDDDYEVGAMYFRRYVKPILVAAAVDYEIVSGTRYGGLARELRDRIHERRRNLAGVLPWPSPIGPNAPVMPFLPTPAEQLQRELDGAVVLIGRPALKEWAWGMKQGWNTEIPAEPVDHEELLAASLSEDDVFQEQPEDSSPNASSEAHDETPLASSTNKFMLPSQIGLQSMSRPGMPSFAGASASHTSPASPESNSAATHPNLIPPSTIPAQPPLCFVDFTNLVGWRNIPRRIAHFFNHRQDVRRGAEAGISIVLGNKSDAKEFDVGPAGSIQDQPPQGGNLDWGLAEEDVYPPRFDKTPARISKEREDFYKTLQTELQASREIARGQREPTKAEKREMPRGEIELRDDRFKNERDWHNLLMGWQILTPASGVAWDEAWRGSLRVLRSREPNESVPSQLNEKVLVEEVAPAQKADA
ncbi:mitochondrial import inner membrane translocase subunit tim54 [Malassezia psittaci]|uniref:Mitochondrial import inner membrane translocase subunit TIM54 n=1 Tax=Malassezia psittaci TaxID=1821823 RepID=A0AAF0JFQ0_9BASI|nr:mitochondrial import inner membrane translocase subunit tim54 [Malassezia psittaci]